MRAYRTAGRFLMSQTLRIECHKGHAPTICSCRRARSGRSIYVGVPARLLRTMAQPPDKLTDGNRRKHDSGDDTADDQLSDKAVMRAGSPQMNTPSGPEQGKTREAEAPQNREPVSPVVLGHAAESMKALWDRSSERTHISVSARWDRAG
jgi:hypothetical protein